MQQFDFNNSRYAKLFSSKDNINFLRTFLNTKGLLYTNYGWYLTQGRRASMPTPTDYDGVASFSIKSRKAEAAPLMHHRGVEVGHVGLLVVSCPAISHDVSRRQEFP